MYAHCETIEANQKMFSPAFEIFYRLSIQPFFSDFCIPANRNNFFPLEWFTEAFKDYNWGSFRHWNAEVKKQAMVWNFNKQLKSIDNEIFD